jgi:hypothetical protein
MTTLIWLTQLPLSRNQPLTSLLEDVENISQPKVWLIMRVQPVYPAGPAHPCFTPELEERANGKLEDPFAFSRVRIKIDPVRGAKRAKG